MQLSPRAVDGISLRRLLPEATILGAADVVVTACSSDSRTCRSGDLFAAVLGPNADGHDFAADALSRGATAVLAEQLVPTRGRPICIVPDSREAYGKLCHALAGNPSHRVKTIGVTGTHGKTITTTLIAGILRAAGHKIGLMGTLGHWDGQDYTAADTTTPTPAGLANLLSRMEANGCSHAVVEISSVALARRHTAGMLLDAACVTNVRRAHLDYHTTVQNYRSAKARVLDHLSPEGFAILNADCAATRELLKLVTGPALTVGMNSAAEVSASVVERNTAEQLILISAGEDNACVRTRILGDHHVVNCLSAAATGLAYGIDLPTIARGLESVDQVPGRQERIICGQPFSVYVDSSNTPDTLSYVLRALRQVTAGKLFCVFGADSDIEPDARPQLAKIVEKFADVAVVTGDNSRHEDPTSIIAEICSGFSATARAQIKSDRTTAIAWALDQAREGDCVLIAGRGPDEFLQIDGHQIPHDDREVARQILYGRSGPASRQQARLAA